MSDATTGTLCRLIELDRIDGEPFKYRVEHGDRGGKLGTVMRALGRGDTPWEAWYLDTDDPELTSQPGHIHLLGRFECPEAAALRLAGERFVARVAEHVATL